ncbi:MAG: DNA repair protein RecO [Bacteroidota bacterium]|nr:DNA repair protein RecO [Bacteroidota bacterium]
MSTIVKTEAVVLKSIDFREMSKIVTFYTRQFGKVTGIVKGARQSKNRYGSSLEPMSYVSLVFYKKDGRDIQIVSHCDLMKQFRHLYEDVDKMAIGMSMIELVMIAVHGHERNIPFFTSLVNSLNALNHATHNPINLLYYFELQLAKEFGFQPSFDHCASCNKKLIRIIDEQTYRFRIGQGGLVCSRCFKVDDQICSLSGYELKILRHIAASKDIESVMSEDIDEKTKITLETFIWTYLQYHITGLRTLKSKQVFAKIKNL